MRMARVGAIVGLAGILTLGVASKLLIQNKQIPIQAVSQKVPINTDIKDLSSLKAFSGHWTSYHARGPGFEYEVGNMGNLKGYGYAEFRDENVCNYIIATSSPEFNAIFAKDKFFDVFKNANVEERRAMFEKASRLFFAPSGNIMYLDGIPYIRGSVDDPNEKYRIDEKPRIPIEFDGEWRQKGGPRESFFPEQIEYRFGGSNRNDISFVVSNSYHDPISVKRIVGKTVEKYVLFFHDGLVYDKNGMRDGISRFESPTTLGMFFGDGEINLESQFGEMKYIRVKASEKEE